MKTPISKFLVFSLTMIMVIAVLNGDCPNAQAAKDLVTEQPTSDSPDIVLVQEQDFSKSENGTSEESEDIFRFPNVFDIFGSIF